MNEKEKREQALRERIKAINEMPIRFTITEEDKKKLEALKAKTEPQTFFISDLHLSHKQILEFSPTRHGKTIDEHNQWLLDNWNKTVSDQDTVWVLGDVVFSQESLDLIRQLKGHKNLVRGNHDKLSTQSYLKHFNNVYGIYKLFGEFWLTHAPVHPNELRGKVNIHGHVHYNSIRTESGALDNRYFNVSVEAIDGVPISLTQIKEYISKNERPDKTGTLDK